MSSINTNMEEVKQKLNKRKNTEEHVCVLFGTEIKRNRHTRSLKIEYSQYFISNKELWTDNLTKLKTFIDLNKRRPAYNKESEKVMYKWLSHQLDNIKTKKEIRSNEDIRGLWDSFIKDYQQYFLSNEELWTNKLTELKAFIDLNKRRPSQVKETEKVLGSWVSTQLSNRKAKKDIMSNENIRNTWDSFIKDYEQYFLSNEELWTNNLTELKSFIDLNKRRPSQVKESEKVLNEWVDTQLENMKIKKQIMINEDIRGMWGSFIKDYSQFFLSNEELWTNNLTELKAFIDLNKRQPIEEKETEKMLCLWLSNQLKNRKPKKYIMLNKDIRGLWDSFIKDYDQYIMANGELWNNNLTELKAFIDLNKRRPKKGQETEKIMYSWLIKQLLNRKEKKQIMYNEDIRNTWDSFTKDYKQYFNYFYY